VFELRREGEEREESGERGEKREERGERREERGVQLGVIRYAKKIGQFEQIELVTFKMRW
jgi:hypothetical protein